MPATAIDSFLAELVAWAATQPDIAAVALVGSHARGAATETSDIDLVLLVRGPQQYLDDARWVERFGSVRRQQVEDYGKVTSLRAWYADGREVEYGLTDETWGAPPLDAGTARVTLAPRLRPERMRGRAGRVRVADGMRVLYEGEPLLSTYGAQP